MGGQRPGGAPREIGFDSSTRESAVRAKDRAHVFQSWAAQRDRDPVVVAGAAGSYFWDPTGRRYLDFASQMHAVRIARLATGRPKVLSAYRSYHGATHLSMHLTGDPRRWPTDTVTAGVVHFFGLYLYRSAFHATTEDEECRRALPPCTATREEVEDGLAILDEAIEVADRYATVDGHRGG